MRWQQRAEHLLEGASAEVRRYPQGFPHLLAAAELMIGKSRELVIVGQRNDPGTIELLQMARPANQPLTPLLFVEAENREQFTKIDPFTKAMKMIDCRVTAYFCGNYACGKPLTDPAELAEQLAISGGG